MDNPLVVNNPKVGFIDIFSFKCSNCGEEFNPEDVDFQCPKCNEELFEKMRKKEFSHLFIDCLSALGIEHKKQVEFINKKDIPFKSLGICTEMSVIVDLNFQLKFGGQYKSFFIKESFNNITANNFNNAKRRG